MNNIYVKFLNEKFDNSNLLMDKIVKDTYHLTWYACRDYAYSILKRDTRWKWLAARIDDYALETTRYIIKQLPHWRWRAGFEIGAMHSHLDNVCSTIYWLCKRWLSVLKNLFDDRYKNYIGTSYLVQYIEN